MQASKNTPSKSKRLSSLSKAPQNTAATNSNPKFSIYEEDSEKSDVFGEACSGISTDHTESKSYAAAISDTVSSNMSKLKGSVGR